MYKISSVFQISGTQVCHLGLIIAIPALVYLNAGTSYAKIKAKKAAVATVSIVNAVQTRQLDEKNGEHIKLAYAYDRSSQKSIRPCESFSKDKNNNNIKEANKCLFQLIEMH